MGNRARARSEFWPRRRPVRAAMLGLAVASSGVLPVAAHAGWTLLLLPPRAPGPPANAPAEVVEKHRASPFDSKAPWEKWNPVAVYASPEECEKGRRERLTRITEKAKGKEGKEDPKKDEAKKDDGKKAPPSPDRIARVMAAYDLARCVSIHEKGLP